MDDNQMYTIFERMVILLYEKGLLTPDILDEVASLFQEKEMGSLEGRWESEDGKGIDQIVVETLYPTELPPRERWNDPLIGLVVIEHWEGKYEEIRKERWHWVV